MQAIRRLHGGQLLIVWLVLLAATVPVALSWIAAVSTFDGAVQKAVDSAPRAHVVIDGLVLDAPSTTQLGVADEGIFRERYAREMLERRGMRSDSAETRAKEIAQLLYYDSSRAYYDGIRAKYRKSHRIAEFLSYIPPLLLLALPLLGLAITWLWLDGRRSSRAPLT